MTKRLRQTFYPLLTATVGNAMLADDRALADYVYPNDTVCFCAGFSKLLRQHRARTEQAERRKAGARTRPRAQQAMGARAMRTSEELELNKVLDER